MGFFLSDRAWHSLPGILLSLFGFSFEIIGFLLCSAMVSAWYFSTAGAGVAQGLLLGVTCALFENLGLWISSIFCSYSPACAADFNLDIPAALFFLTSFSIIGVLVERLYHH